jgi:2-succinyl-5-enolpyruvyl-6-hydroxy-3-cyclohexene-1-carboxylate synthase
MSVPIDAQRVGDADRQAAFCATLVDEWIRAGVTHAVVCPGSRSTPLALAIASEPRLILHVRLDERSAGFTALGIGMVTGIPAVVLVTSGTAAVELHPAVVEADLANIPLLVCTADRPPELRDVGSPQTIDQTHLFGRAPRWFADPGVADESTRWSWRSLGSRSVAEATSGPHGPGPIHLNLPFREPLLGDAIAGAVPVGRPDGRPWHQFDVPLSLPSPEAIDDLVAAAGFTSGTRGLIVAGAGCGDSVAVLALAESLDWPVLADPRSGLRIGDHRVVGAADGILRSVRFAASHRPDIVLRLGERWASNVVHSFLAGSSNVVVDLFGWTDPERSAERVIRCDPTMFCRFLTAAQGEPDVGTTDWTLDWQAAEIRAQLAIATAFAEMQKPTEPMLAQRVFAAVAGGSQVVVSSSMPVRDLEAFAIQRADAPRVLANRGVNGIDGVVSTALGVALAGGPTTVLVGDLAFLHDSSALVGPAAERPLLTIVVADNGGGGIFSFLPQATQVDAARFERLFATPQSADPVAVAHGFGWDVVEIDGEGWVAALDAALTPHRGGRVVVVRLPDGTANVTAHDHVNAAVIEAVERRRVEDVT